MAVSEESSEEVNPAGGAAGGPAGVEAGPEEDAKDVLRRLQNVRLEDTIDATAEEVVAGMESDDPERRERAEAMLDCQNMVYNIYKSCVEAAAAGNPEFQHSDEEYLNVSVLGGRIMEKYGPGELLKYGLEIQFVAYLGATWFGKLHARQQRVKREEEKAQQLEKQQQSKQKSDAEKRDHERRIPTPPVRQ